MENERAVQEIQAGIQKRENLERLYYQNIALIRQIVRENRWCGERDDLMQEAFFGLQQAAEHYKTGKDAQFSTYMKYWIVQALRRYYENCGRAKRLPSYLVSLIQKYQRFLRSWENRTGQRPGDAEICRELEISQRQLDRLRRYIYEDSVSSLDEPLSETDDFTLGDAISDGFSMEETALDAVAREQAGRLMWETVAALPGKAPLVLKEEYRSGKTLSEIGEELKISFQRVRQIRVEAFRVLRRKKQIKQAAELMGYSYRAFHGGLSFFKNTGLSSVEYIAERCEKKESRADCLMLEYTQSVREIWGDLFSEKQ